MTATPAIETWFQDESEEDGMFEDHAYLWRHLISMIPHKDLSQQCVLDYGCNRGDFLQALYGTHPFKHGIGVDVASASLAIARQRNKHIKAEFIQPDEMGQYRESVDIAFSHEVLYLLPDLDTHAASMTDVLKKGGAYYAAIGCHTHNTLWARWRDLIAATTNLPVFDYSLDDYARAFRNAGTRVEMRPFQLQDFVLIKPDNDYFPTAADSLAYHTDIKTVIRATKER